MTASAADVDTIVYTDVDREEFASALAKMLCHREPVYRRNFKRRLAERKEPWDEIGRHAAAIAQSEAMDLTREPWVTQPCNTEVNTADAPGFEVHRTAAASALLEKLLAAGLSRWTHDRAVLQAVANGTYLRDVRVEGGDTAMPASAPRSSSSTPPAK
jgi:hypothetical protein